LGSEKKNMKTKITYIACILFISALCSTLANEDSGTLKIVMTQVAETGQKEVSAYIYKTKAYEPRITYQYKFYCILKNVGDEEITVATKNLDPGIMHGDEAETPVAELSIDKMSYEGCQIIPSAADFGLVVLRPGECTGIRWEKSSSRRLNSVRVQYNPKDIYDNRFGYWSGRVTGKPVEVIVPKKQKPQP
jgi:hypothetical protein